MGPKKRSKRKNSSQKGKGEVFYMNNLEVVPETEFESLQGSLNNLEVGQLATVCFAAVKLNQHIHKC